MKGHLLRSACACATVALIVTGSMRAQQPGNLKPASASLKVPLDYMTSIRELGDGRVLMSELGEHRLIVADLKSGSVVTIGRVGNGPQEYQNAFPVRAAGKDTSFMVDPFGRRWLLLVGDRIVATLPPAHPAVKALASIFVRFDSLGEFLSVAQHKTAVDSESLVLGSTRTGIQRVVGHLPPPIPGAPAGPQAAFSPQYEIYTLSSDGWVVVVRANPYRVDWRDPSGHWLKGPALSYPAVKVNAQEKAVFKQKRAAEGRRELSDSMILWSSTVPPVMVTSDVLVSGDGRAIVQRISTAAHPGTLYDVINRRGLRERQLELAPNELIVGFGKGSVYVITIDQDGLQYLSRHPWP